MPQKKRLIWLDVAKGLAIVLVVLGHCLDHDVPLRTFVYSFHMPLFFVLAGFTMRAKPRLQVLKTSARRLLVPYFAVCAVLMLFAFVPPSSVSPALDSQFSPDVVLVEILYGAGESGDAFGLHFEAIGALWFLPCLFVARIVLNEVLLIVRKANKAETFLAVALVAACVWGGFALGNIAQFPFDIDTALIAVGFMFVGMVAKRVGLECIPWYAWVLLFAVWMFYPVAGENEMATRLYLDAPATLITAAAGSLVVMRLCMLVERVPFISGGLARCGVSSLFILCVHRIETAVFNWQKIMEILWPQVWDASVLVQGLYWFGLRIVFVLAVVWLLKKAASAVRA